MNQYISNSIEKASKVIGKTWPLYTFVASNPLSGYEKMPFYEAVGLAKSHLNTSSYPKAAYYKQAFLNGDLNKDILLRLLADNGLTDSPAYYLQLLESVKETQVKNVNHDIDRIMVKWLSAFMDEGIAEWDMPYKTEGFYTAWRYLIIYDSELGSTSLKDVPKSSANLLNEIMSDYSESECEKIFTYHLSALPGWTGYINHRTASNSDWQLEYPISLEDYLAVRLWTVRKMNAELLPERINEESDKYISKVQYTFLKAWEESWQNQLVKRFDKAHKDTKSNITALKPDAQMVFCIDTRSELIRRHIESKGNYETFGYAGFFGITMDYKSLEDDITRKSCPPIVSSGYIVSEIPQSGKENSYNDHKKNNVVLGFGKYFLGRMKNMLPSAFGYVEGSGLYYGLGLLGRTLMPSIIYRNRLAKNTRMEAICQPEMIKESFEIGKNGVSLSEKVAIVKSAFDLLGWKNFAPVVLFVGHGSHSANNPFSSSLDCGACAASPGRHNARMLAKLANLQEVREMLKSEYTIFIPDNTIFIGAEHNTTTDEIVLFDAEVDTQYEPLIKDLKSNLLKAQKSATKDRLKINRNSITVAQSKANSWSETRPEWGLAKNAGFIIGPRKLTTEMNLDSRCFLHSYNWQLDTDGKALVGIMQGPMVVTQWINNHYYFSTVDNNIYGGGSKITHNVTGKFGVVQGNGGDLKMGLPLQSLFGSDEDIYHQPLRLSVVIQAPKDRVIDILSRNENLRTLLDNEWIYLMVMNPEEDNQIFRYKKSLKWTLVSDNIRTIPSKKPETIKEYSEKTVMV